jgi:two-component system, LytTR family, response regulator
MTLRVLIVDDEPPARLRLRTMIEMLPDADDLELIPDAEDGVSAVERITEERPDAVFLDVQMPGLDGFGVVRALATDAAEHGELLPFIVFATAYEEHAIQAFEASAVDYLLKPFNGRRLAQAVERVRQRHREREALQRAASAPDELPAEFAALIAALPARAVPLDRVAVRVGERVYWVRTEELNWVTADGNYLRLRTGAGTAQSREHLIRRPLSVFAQELDPRRFARIHRSVLVNIDRIKELRAIADGEYQVIMDEGTRFKLSRSYRRNLPDF